MNRISCPIIFLLVVAIIFVSFFPIIENPNIRLMDESDRQSDRIFENSILHDPILISSNADFESQGWPGNGTADTPYLLANLVINSYTTPISISNTTAYFTIQNCTIISSTYGIILSDVSNGKVVNSRIEDAIYGIWLEFCSNSSIIACYVDNPQSIGIRVDFSENVILQDNIGGERHITVYEEWMKHLFIYINESSDCVIDNCSILEGRSWDEWRYGIEIHESTNCTLSSSVISEPYQSWGVIINRSALCLIEYCSFSNLRTGIEITGSSDCTVTNCEFRTDDQNGAIDIWSSTNCSIIDSIFSDAWSGVILSGTEDCILSNNIFRNVSYGISFWYGDSDAVVASNQFYQIREGGISLEASSRIDILDNNISYVTKDALGYEGAGIKFEGSTACFVSGNLIHHFQTGILFDSSDYIQCNENALLLNQRHGIFVSEGCIYNTFEENSIGWNAISNAEDNGHQSFWYRNYWSDSENGSTYELPGTSHESDDEPLVLSTDYNLPPVIQYNPYDTYIAAVIPSTTHHIISWYGSDMDPHSYQILLNGSEIESNSWSGGEISLMVFHETPGHYNYTLILTDSNGNSISSDTILIVYPPTQLAINFTYSTIIILPIIAGLAITLILWRMKYGPRPPPNNAKLGIVMTIVALIAPALISYNEALFLITSSTWSLELIFWYDYIYFASPLNSGYAILFLLFRLLFVLQIYRYYEGITSLRLTISTGILAESPYYIGTIYYLLFPDQYYYTVTIPVSTLLVLGLAVLWFFKRKSISTPSQNREIPSEHYEKSTP